jgi:hypothetical protein
MVMQGFDRVRASAEERVYVRTPPPWNAVVIARHLAGQPLPAQLDYLARAWTGEAQSIAGRSRVRLGFIVDAAFPALREWFQSMKPGEPLQALIELTNQQVFFPLKCDSRTPASPVSLFYRPFQAPVVVTPDIVQLVNSIRLAGLSKRPAPEIPAADEFRERASIDVAAGCEPGEYAQKLLCAYYLTMASLDSILPLGSLSYDPYELNKAKTAGASFAGTVQMMSQRLSLVDKAFKERLREEMNQRRLRKIGYCLRCRRPVELVGDGVCPVSPDHTVWYQSYVLPEEEQYFLGILGCLRSKRWGLFELPPEVASRL